MGDTRVISTFYAGIHSSQEKSYEARNAPLKGYETVSPTGGVKMSAEDAQSSMLSTLRRLEKDRLARTLIENSHLTNVQFATLLIDTFWSSPTAPSPMAKLQLRPDRERVTKGAFNRSLSQARRNVIKSIYTVFLLAYFGLFDSPKLEPFLRLGDEMKTYLDAKRENSAEGDREAYNATRVLEDALQTAVGELAKMACFKRQRDIT
jgi:hypothetical protein